VVADGNLKSKPQACAYKLRALILQCFLADFWPAKCQPLYGEPSPRVNDSWEMIARIEALLFRLAAVTEGRSTTRMQTGLLCAADPAYTTRFADRCIYNRVQFVIATE
jgi:hypothetical protein